MIDLISSHWRKRGKKAQQTALSDEQCIKFQRRRQEWRPTLFYWILYPQSTNDLTKTVWSGTEVG